MFARGDGWGESGRGLLRLFSPVFDIAIFSLFFKKKKTKHKVRFSLSSLHSSIHIPPLGWWKSAYCVFVLIAVLGTLTRQMTDTGQIKSVVRSSVGSSHYHSQDSFAQESTLSWLVMLQGQK